MSDDLISRQAILKHIEKTREAVQFMDDTHRASIIMNGMYLCEEAVRNQPSAQQEIIQCKDCKYSYAMITAKSKDGQERWIRFCDKHKNWYPKDDWFCADGEREEK